VDILPNLGRIVSVLLRQEMTPLTRWTLQGLLQALCQSLASVSQPAIALVTDPFNIACGFELLLGQKREQ
jgi:hypothetical protein